MHSNNPMFKRIDKKDENGIKPHIIQHFKSLEGEGGNNAVGVTTLFLRLNKCNCTCTFCDTAFSIKGEEKYNLVRADTSELHNLLQVKYSDDDRQYIHSCSITGGEPLIHLESFEDIFNNILESFTKVDSIIIETNGNLLYNEHNCMELLKVGAKFSKKLKITLSISPKLDGRVSYGNKMTNAELIDVYDRVLCNYHTYLDKMFDIQVKFVHGPGLEEQNKKLIDLILDKKYIEPRTKILIMPFTPPMKSKNFEQVWKESKDAAANYALTHYLRYSPRIHIDRGLD